MNERIPLGRPTPYPDHYSPELLYGIPRSQQRAALGLGPGLPFHGSDIWNAWELTWLDTSGLPRCATAEIRVPAESVQLIESKSLKLYLNSFAMTRFASADDLAEVIRTDLGQLCETEVSVTLRCSPDFESADIARLPGYCLDTLNLHRSSAEVDPSLLHAEPGDLVSEELYTHLLRCLCPVTGQPDQGSVLVSYRGPRVDREGLLAYIVSYRQHREFHESCVERMFVDILRHCEPEKLTVYARYQRRGGIDINPFRSNFDTSAPNSRLWRQ